MEQEAPRRNGKTVTGALIVAATRLYRDGLAEALRRHETLRVVGTAAEFDEALVKAQSFAPHVILVDMPMPNGSRTIQALARELPEAKILALVSGDAELVASVEAGADGCVTRESSLEQVASAVERVAHGEAICDPEMTAALFKRLRSLAAGRPDDLGVPLTPREQEIVALIDEGFSNKQIAQRLCIEPATVKNHVHNILEKLHVARRGEAAAVVRHRAYAERRAPAANTPRNPLDPS